MSPTEFDYELLSSRGISPSPIVRDSILLRFDPLLSKPLVVSQSQSIGQIAQGQQNISTLPEEEQDKVLYDNRKSVGHNKRKSTAIKRINIKTENREQLPTHNLLDISLGQGDYCVKVEVINN